MNELTEWWQFVSRFSPFLVAMGAALAALLIRDLLDPHQWRRLVRKTLASAASGILVFGGMLWGYVALVRFVGNEESLLIDFIGFIVALAIFPATVVAIAWAFRSVDPDFSRYVNSRFAHSFRNGQWPILSVNVRSECLPESVTFITGRIVPVRDRVGSYQLHVAVGFGSNTKITLEETTRNPRRGWVKMMTAALNAQVGNHRKYAKWWERLSWLGYARSRPKDQRHALTSEQKSKWQDRAYMQIYDLARRVDANGVLR